MDLSPLPVLALLPHGADWIWIAIIALILFGPKRLPELARGLGKTLGEFKKAKDEMEEELRRATHMADVTTTTATPVSSLPNLQPAPHLSLPPREPAAAASTASSPIPPEATTPVTEVSAQAPAKTESTVLPA